MSARDRGMWLLSGMTAMGAVLCGQFGWCSALAGLAAALLLYNIVGADTPLPTFARGLQALWLAVPLCAAAKGAAALFPDAGNGWYVPAVTLALGWLLARRKREAVGACCTVVGFFVLAAVGVVVIFAVPGLRLSWLAPEFDWRGVLLAFALGSGGFVVPQASGGKPGRGWGVCAYVVPVLLSAVTAAALSPRLAAMQPSAFYTLSRSISVFGVVERFEALIAACLSLGIFCACAAILCAARSLCPEKYADGLSAALCLAALVGTQTTSGGVIFAAGTAILWVLLPLIKNMRKMKKGVDKSAS